MLYYQIAFGIIGVVFPYCIYFLFPFISRQIKSYTITLQIYHVF